MVLKFEEFINENFGNNNPNIKNIDKKEWGYDGHNIRTAKVNVESKKLMDELCEWFGKYLKQAMGCFGVLSDRRDFKVKDLISWRQDDDMDGMYLILFKFKGGGPNSEFLKNQSHVSFDFIMDKPINKYTFFTLKDEFLDKLTMFISTDFADGEINYDSDDDSDVKHIRLTLYNAIIAADKTRKDDKLHNLLKNMDYDGKNKFGDD